MNTNNEIKENILIESFLVDILKYLNLKELAIIRQTSKTFKHLIDDESNIIFEKLNISIFEDKINIEWFCKIIKNNQIKILNVLLCDNFYYIRQILFTLNPIYVEVLKVPSNFFMSDKDLIRFVNLKHLTIKNMYFCEGGLEEEMFIIENIIQMPWLQSIKLNNLKYVKATFLNCLTNRFTKLDFRESVNFRIEDMSEFILTQIDHLQIIRLDGENSHENSLKYCLSKSTNLIELFIGYCENYIGTFLNEINYLKNLQKLILRKMRVKKIILQNFFQNFNMNKIIKLDLYDCPHLNNLCVNLIADKSPNLEYLELSWSNGIENDAIIKLLKNCHKLKYLYLQGCKNLDDNIFEDYLTNFEFYKNKFNNKISAINNIKLIDFSKCDMINDSTLFKLIKIYPNLSFLNYYRNEIKYEN